MKTGITLLLVALFYCNALAQEVNFKLGVEIAPSFTINPSRLYSPTTNVVAEFGFETVVAHVAISSNELNVGTYFGTKNVQVGIFAKATISQSIQLTPAIAFRYSHYVRHGLVLQIGAKMDLPLDNNRIHTYTPLFIGVQKKLIND